MVSTVSLKHQNALLLVIVGGIYPCDNEAIKQKQTQTQNQKPKTKQTSGGKKNEKIYQEGRFKEGFQPRRTYLRNRNHLHPRRRTALQLHRSLQELHGSTRRNLIPKQNKKTKQPGTSDPGLIFAIGDYVLSAGSSSAQRFSIFLKMERAMSMPVKAAAIHARGSDATAI